MFLVIERTYNNGKMDIFLKKTSKKVKDYIKNKAKYMVSCTVFEDRYMMQKYLLRLEKIVAKNNLYRGM